MAQRGTRKKEKPTKELSKITDKAPGRRGRPRKEDKSNLPEVSKIVQTTQVRSEELKAILGEVKREETKTLKQANTPGVSPVQVNVLYNHTIKKK